MFGKQFGEKSLILDNMQKKEIPLVNMCFLCLGDEEMVDRMLLHCMKSQILWSLLFTLKDMLRAWHCRGIRENQREEWWVAPLCLFWIEWKQRNKIASTDALFMFRNGAKCFFLPFVNRF